LPTMNPRIQVTMKRSQYELLKRLAKLQGRSMSAVVSELFDQLEPVYERIAVVLQAAVRAQASAKEGLVRATEQAEAEMAPHVAQAMGQLDLLVQTSQGWPGGAEAASMDAPLRQASNPRPVTRGSGLPRTGGTVRATRSIHARKPRNLRDIRKSPGRKLGAAIAAAVQQGPRGKKRRRK
jgi:hypothetical protein